MNPRHHPASDWLLALGAGTLDEAQAAVVAAHAEWCPDCRAKVDCAEAIGGAMLASLPPSAMSAGAFARFLQRMAAADNLREQGSAAPLNGFAHSGLPLSLAKIVPHGIDVLPWKRLAPGVRGVRLPIHSRHGIQLCLFEAEPGAVFDSHTHGGSEMSLVLRGAYHVNGLRFGPGDSEDSEPGSRHMAVADPEEGCLCVAFIEGANRPDGILARLLQPFKGL